MAIVVVHWITIQCSSLLVCWIKEKEVKLGRMWLESQVHDYTTTAHSGSYWLIHRMLGQYTIFLWSRVILQTTSLSFWGRFHDCFCHGTVDKRGGGREISTCFFPVAKTDFAWVINWRNLSHLVATKLLNIWIGNFSPATSSHVIKHF